MSGSHRLIIAASMFSSGCVEGVPIGDLEATDEASDAQESSTNSNDSVEEAAPKAEACRAVTSSKTSSFRISYDFSEPAFAYPYPIATLCSIIGTDPLELSCPGLINTEGKPLEFTVEVTTDADVFAALIASWTGQRVLFEYWSHAFDRESEAEGDVIRLRAEGGSSSQLIAVSASTMAGVPFAFGTPEPWFPFGVDLVATETLCDPVVCGDVAATHTSQGIQQRGESAFLLPGESRRLPGEFLYPAPWLTVVEATQGTCSADGDNQSWFAFSLVLLNGLSIDGETD